MNNQLRLAVILILMTLFLLGCSPDQEAGLDIDEVIQEMRNEFAYNKEQAIKIHSPRIEASIFRLEAVCKEEADAGIDTSDCYSQLIKLRTNVKNFKSGDWDQLPSVSLEEYAKLYYEIIYPHVIIDI